MVELHLGMKSKLSKNYLTVYVCSMYITYALWVSAFCQLCVVVEFWLLCDCCGSLVQCGIDQEHGRLIRKKLIINRKYINSVKSFVGVESKSLGGG